MRSPYQQITGGCLSFYRVSAICSNQVMNSEVKVLYDFSAQPGSGELTITAGEVLRVTRTDVGDGWWEGINSRGMSGLFPEGYVEQISVQPVATGTEDLANEEYWPEDDWDDDDSQTSASINDLSQQQSNTQRGSISKPVIKKSYNRFSTFVKSGAEDYILGTKNKVVDSGVQVYVVEENGVMKWAPHSSPVYTCQVTSPSKEAKLGGLKSFIAYKITPSFNNIQVSRRYKHFDWLQGRLAMKFISIPYSSVAGQTNFRSLSR